MCAVCTEQQKTSPRHEIDESSKCGQYSIEIVVDVGVVEFDVVDDSDVGQILQELGGLVEKCTVVFVSLDDKRRTRPPIR